MLATATDIARCGRSTLLLGQRLPGGPWPHCRRAWTATSSITGSCSRCGRSGKPWAARSTTPSTWSPSGTRNCAGSARTTSASGPRSSRHVNRETCLALRGQSW